MLALMLPTREGNSRRVCDKSTYCQPIPRRLSINRLMLSEEKRLFIASRGRDSGIKMPVREEPSPHVLYVCSASGLCYVRLDTHTRALTQICTDPFIFRYPVSPWPVLSCLGCDLANVHRLALPPHREFATHFPRQIAIETAIMSLREVASAEFYQLSRRTEGKLLVAQFTATWCGPCRRVAPQYEALARRTPDVEFIKVKPLLGRLRACATASRSASWFDTAVLTIFFFTTGVVATHAEWSGGALRQKESYGRAHDTVFSESDFMPPTKLLPSWLTLPVSPLCVCACVFVCVCVFFFSGLRAQQPRCHNRLGRPVVPDVPLLSRRGQDRRVQGGEHRTSRAESESASGGRKVRVVGLQYGVQRVDAIAVDRDVRVLVCLPALHHTCALVAPKTCHVLWLGMCHGNPFFFVGTVSRKLVPVTCLVALPSVSPADGDGGRVVTQLPPGCVSWHCSVGFLEAPRCWR